MQDKTGGSHEANTLFLYLEIDTRLRMAELGKLVGDLQAIEIDY